LVSKVSDPKEPPTPLPLISAAADSRLVLRTSEIVTPDEVPPI
jgi:hypothetical protein